MFEMKIEMDFGYEVNSMLKMIEAKSLDKIKAKVAEMESKKIRDNLMKVLTDFSQLD